MPCFALGKTMVRLAREYLCTGEEFGIPKMDRGEEGGLGLVFNGVPMNYLIVSNMISAVCTALLYNILEFDYWSQRS